MILGSLLYLLAGAVLLYFGAEWLVSGSTGLARLFRIPSLIIGLTIVAYGTSSPEIVVGVQASVGGHGDIALGTVLGSNIANICLILGASAFLKPTKVNGTLIRRKVPVLLVTALALFFALMDGTISRFEGFLFLLAGVLYTAWMIIDAKQMMRAAQEGLAATEESAEEAGGIDNTPSKSRTAAIALLGLIVLIVGGSLFVDGATSLALTLGMSKRLVGLTIVAIGTSLPELAISLLAAWRGHSDIVVGNVVGSNIFNLVLCLGLAAMIAPISSPKGSASFDVMVLLLTTAIAAFMIRKDRYVSRHEGGLLLCGYGVFLVLVAI